MLECDGAGRAEEGTTGFRQHHRGPCASLKLFIREAKACHSLLKQERYKWVQNKTQSFS